MTNLVCHEDGYELRIDDIGLCKIVMQHEILNLGEMLPQALLVDGVFAYNSSHPVTQSARVVMKEAIPDLSEDEITHRVGKVLVAIMRVAIEAHHHGIDLNSLPPIASSAALIERMQASLKENTGKVIDPSLN